MHGRLEKRSTPDDLAGVLFVVPLVSVAALVAVAVVVRRLGGLVDNGRLGGSRNKPGDHPSSSIIAVT
jgi:hypothetical protein